MLILDFILKLTAICSFTIVCVVVCCLIAEIFEDLTKERSK